MTKEAIKQLHSNLTQILPKGAIKEISAETGLDRNSVRMILQGVWSNERVIQAALKILTRQKTAIEQTINDLTHGITC